MSRTLLAIVIAIAAFLPSCFTPVSPGGRDDAAVKWAERYRTYSCEERYLLDLEASSKGEKKEIRNSLRQVRRNKQLAQRELNRWRPSRSVLIDETLAHHPDGPCCTNCSRFPPGS